MKIILECVDVIMKELLHSMKRAEPSAMEACKILHVLIKLSSKHQNVYNLDLIKILQNGTEE